MDMLSACSQELYKVYVMLRQSDNCSHCLLLSVISYILGFFPLSSVESKLENFPKYSENQLSVTAGMEIKVFVPASRLQKRHSFLPRFICFPLT